MFKRLLVRIPKKPRFIVAVNSCTQRGKLLTFELRYGDIERAQLEWHSLLRQISGAPKLDFSRWSELQHAARVFLEAFPITKKAMPGRS